ncbi:NADH-quinone oxidoreductase subunit D [Candidatus Nitrosopelagicus sp.]|nr:NADH-quinone oxidoreductase subunit D [Candidatus Nitrosopelagicus sp.]MDC0064081.1 NADH-quinone oxidoreductase subunit D [Candidatus Nitrosopelagicus sp.]MDC0168512.1 NADH-quinone oxidoreductase subunit D [Candidatus Nitrosopelagicus sp.]MDC0171805.1 NADH-quinone oxidoreductase subunit D [Candidatus Nitrosopelagicus sp.]MDC0187176.1 NADH-quinone oxidoreductase subunit D [Candidatus Nitrosopelagicus sp.]|tara:strand:- start:990 stop:2141 length:1152 start_codon:yes stop_codon:yes gene_type:complete
MAEQVIPTKKMPPGLQVENVDDRIMTLNVGPQHPGSGHMRIIVKIDGDYIVDADPDPGYVHRGEEKMAESRNYITNIPHLERPVIHDSCNILYPYVLGVEDLVGIEVPERAKYVRVIAAELNRCIYIQYWLAIYGIFLGHSTMFMWPAGDRELLIDLMEKITGARVTHAYFIPGGVRNDVPANFEDVCLRQVNYFEKRIKEYADIFYDNPILKARTEDTGVLSREDAIRLGTTGSVLRASGVDYDLRIKEPYDVYDELDVHTNVLKSGDSYARSKIPWLDMLESCNIIRQALEKMPKSGSIRTKLKPNPKGREDEVYRRVESGRGSAGCHIISRGKPEPYRLKLSVSSFRNLIALPYLLKGEKLGNMPAVYWSLNYWPVEADR